MMGLILYGIFALTTAIMACVYLLAPVMQEQKKPIEHPYLTVLVFFILAVLGAPVVLYSTIFTAAGESFKEHLAKGLFPEE